MTRKYKEIKLIPWPAAEIKDNFKFEALVNGKQFTFNFKWQNNRWDCWVTFPDATVKQAGVYPGVLNWASALDYSLVFISELPELNKENLFLTSIVLIIWP